MKTSSIINACFNSVVGPCLTLRTKPAAIPDFIQYANEPSLDCKSGRDSSSSRSKVSQRFRFFFASLQEWTVVLLRDLSLCDEISRDGRVSCSNSRGGHLCKLGHECLGIRDAVRPCVFLALPCCPPRQAVSMFKRKFWNAHSGVDDYPYTEFAKFVHNCRAMLGFCPIEV